MTISDLKYANSLRERMKYILCMKVDIMIVGIDIKESFKEWQKNEIKKLNEKIESL